MVVTRLIYYSQNHVGPTVRELSSILNASERNNRPLGITGALIFDRQWFLQLLEGEREKVWHTFTRISEDERHSDVVVAEVIETEARVFGSWWMGVAARDDTSEHAFMPFLRDGRFDPPQMAASDMLLLLKNMSCLGLSRRTQRLDQYAAAANS